MCGFLGIHNNENFSLNFLKDSLNLLIHRGRDDTNIKYIESLKIFLGFQRLAIQDLSNNGNQPMSDKNDKIQIIFNGEIYNFKELRKELKKKGFNFYNQSDTEVILVGYKCWGIKKLLSKIEGMFSFGLLDQNQKKIYLARDKFGMKPMFYSNNKSFIFSSECKAILKLLKTNRWDNVGVLNPMFTTYLPPEGRTLFENIHELKQGNYLEYSLKEEKIEIFEYFSLRNFVNQKYYEEISNFSHTEILNLYDEILKKSVSKHLVSDVPLGILFSAGLDSSLIAKVAEKSFQNNKKELFFFNTKDQNYQFLSFAKEFSNNSGYNLNVISEENIDFLPQIIDQLYYYEAPNKPEGIVLSSACKEAYKKGFKVLLTGDAADELLAGYTMFNDFFTSQLSSKNIFLKSIFKLINKFQPFDLYKFSNISPIKTGYFLNPSKIGLAELPFNLLLNGEERLSNWKKNIEAYDFISDENEKHNQSFILDGLSSQLPRYLLRSDRLGMKETVELRLPYLDDEFVRLILNTPLKYKIRFSLLKSSIQTKKILRDLSIKNNVPKNIIKRKKFGTPFVFTKKLKELCSKVNFKHCSDILKIKDEKIKYNLLNSYDEDIDRAQYGFLSTEILGRLFIEGKTRDEIKKEFL